MSPQYLLLAITLPVVLGLACDDGPRAYYVAQAALVAILLSTQRNAHGRAWRIVCWVGIAIQSVAGLYGLAYASGAVEWEVILMILLGLAVVAEVVLALEMKRCQQTTK